MKTIYLIMEERLYGYEVPLKAFASEEAAYAYIKEYNSHSNKLTCCSVEEIGFVEE